MSSLKDFKQKPVVVYLGGDNIDSRILLASVRRTKGDDAIQGSNPNPIFLKLKARFLEFSLPVGVGSSEVIDNENLGNIPLYSGVFISRDLASVPLYLHSGQTYKIL